MNNIIKCNFVKYPNAFYCHLLPLVTKMLKTVYQCVFVCAASKTHNFFIWKGTNDGDRSTRNM